jgi:hypothetical protein
MECHKETICTAVLNKQKCLLLKNEGQEGKAGLVWGTGTSGKGETIRKGYKGEYGGNTMYSYMQMEK